MIHNEKRTRAFTLIEILTVIAIIGLLTGIIIPTARQAILSSSLATSASNLRQIAAGGAAYLVENNHTFWPYRKNIRESGRRGVEWWFGFETLESMQRREGERWFQPGTGPLGGFIPAGPQPDPSFDFAGNAFKPKFQMGYIGIGYNVHLGGGWMGTGDLVRFSRIKEPARTVVFATSAQVNTFQKPASSDNPMIEEFYGIDEQFKTVHFRHRGEALVSYADSSIGFLPLEGNNRDDRDPDANVGSLDRKYLLPRP